MRKTSQPEKSIRTDSVVCIATLQTNHFRRLRNL